MHDAGQCKPCRPLRLDLDLLQQQKANRQQQQLQQQQEHVRQQHPFLSCSI